MAGKKPAPGIPPEHLRDNPLIALAMENDGVIFVRRNEVEPIARYVPEPTPERRPGFLDPMQSAMARPNFR